MSSLRGNAPPASGQTAQSGTAGNAAQPNAAAGDVQGITPTRDLMLRYGVAMIGVLHALLSVVLLLIQYHFIYSFLIVAPLTAMFPFSYLAYVAFQRSVRVERLKRDFYLMGARWDDDLFEQAQGFWNFALHITLAIMMTLAGITIFFAPPVAQLPPILQGLVNDAVLEAMRYGFIGAYLFSIQLIYRRYTTFDLHPSVYMYCALTILAGLAFNYAAAQAIATISQSTDTAQGLGGGMTALLSFALGFFPLLAIQWLTRVAYSALGFTNRRSEDLQLSLIDGVSQLHETRLRDHGIDNIQNLASVDIPFLLINTTFNAQEVLDWVDQAILYLYLAASDIDSFRRGRIRTISDFREMWGPLFNLPDNDDNNRHRTEKALQLQSTPDQLDLLYRASDHGPNLSYIINYWLNADFDTILFYDYKYNATLEEALFLPDNDQEDIAEHQRTIDDLCEESGGKVTPRNAQAYAGLGRLTMELCLGSSQQRLDHANEALKYYSEAVKLGHKVNQQVVDDMKFLTDVQMSMVDKEEQLADAAHAAGDQAGEQSHLEMAAQYAESAVTTSRLFYSDGSCNISYLSRLAAIKLRLGDLSDAQRLLRDAKDLASAIPSFDPTLLNKINSSLLQVNQELKIAPTASSNGSATPAPAPTPAPTPAAAAPIPPPACARTRSSGCVPIPLATPPCTRSSGCCASSQYVPGQWYRADPAGAARRSR